MAEEILNRVANSKLITFNLEDYYPEGERVLFDVKDWLLEGFVLRESEFREQAKNHDWSQYEGKFIALTCSSDAIIPAWAFMLLATYLQPYAKKIITGDLETLETVLYTEAILKMDVSDLQDKPVIVKGCAHKPVPKNAYLLLIEKLQPVVKSLMYGEACSSVPLYKKPKN
ncbi:DUF2480 family protein [Salegentibacter mishustinae]|uniref:DUF2480 family protein n=1 Tax=Salegentibacter mishustinae TaxID=270918 RepID=A0A0Q9Z4N7_9FLAO|nr:DUF2480 family protein [Salegentibacter mishustinae]KRG27836.1 hypothetical protein APR42_08770 [Salegentibacter mishustinae]PNW20903.1 hypothetical protein APB85_06395 [Salegentibacter mishustinae]PZX64086.1 uncharacterized protein DUF2480 [Salegentibacter mishustinae]GGW90062.1 hypothetical protein GCM10008086_18800 [Salegentibacter mishustinae]